MAADQITLARIKQIHPKLRENLLKDYMYVNEKILGKGVRLRFAYTYRTPEEQNQLYALGRTKKGSKVTNSQAWQSIHQYGLAFDIVLLLDKNGDGIFEEASWDIMKDFDKDGTPDWTEVADYFQSKGWNYGGTWKNFKDYPHFEYTFGHTWQSLNQKINSKQYKEEIVDGIKIKYVNI